MAVLKTAIKDNIMSVESKYKYDGEKIGQVIEVNKATKTCTIYVVTRDGISSVEYNVLVKCEKLPKVGDLVEINEQFKKFTITGIFNQEEYNTILESDIYTNEYSGAINGYVGI